MLPHIDYSKTTSTGWLFNPKGGDVEHLNVEHPNSLDQYLRSLPNLYSVAFVFNKSAFKKAGLSHMDQLNEVLEQKQLTRLSITGSNQLMELPEQIKDHPLRSLIITSCPKIIVIGDLLSSLPSLEYLELNGEYFDIGATFPHLPNLKYFNFRGKGISSLDQISNCQALEGLQFSKIETASLPEEISDLSMLKDLNISNAANIEYLPSLKNNTRLEQLKLMYLTSLKSINCTFLNKKELKRVSFIKVGIEASDLEFPEELAHCPKLENVLLNSLNISEIPESFGQLKLLQHLEFNNLRIDSIPDNLFEEMQLLQSLKVVYSQLDSIPRSASELRNLEFLTLEHVELLKSFEIDFSKLQKLKNFKLNSCQELHSIDDSLSRSSSLESLALTDLPLLEKLPPLGNENTAFVKLGVRNLSGLKELPSTFSQLPSLRVLSIISSGIKQFPDDMGNLVTLNQMTIFGSEIEYFPLSIVNLRALRNVSLTRETSNQNPEIISIRELFPHLQKLEDKALREAIFFWAGYAFEYLPITKDIKLKTIEALQHSVKNLPLLVFSNIHRFNPDQKIISSNDLKAGDKIWINGTINGSKTDFKNRLKAMGLKVVTKYSNDIRFVVLGKKPSIPEGLFDNDILFASQLSFENISKSENPGLLEQEDVPLDFIHNLQQLLWSGDPQNEAIALELVKTNGLPEFVEEDFLLSAKVSTDKNLRNRIRTFIRGRISEAKQKALSTGSAPFAVEKMNRVLPKDSLVRMHFAYYKRTGVLNPVYFEYDPEGKHVYRAEAFQGILATFLKNPQYLKSYVPFLEHEWNQLFEHETFKGKLRRIIVRFNNLNKVPERLFDHIETMKDIDANTNKGFEVEGFFRFYKLNKFRIQTRGLKIFPKGIGQLKRLRNLSVYSDHRLEIPEDLKELDKLKGLSIQNWENKNDFLAFIETVK